MAPENEENTGLDAASGQQVEPGEENSEKTPGEEGLRTTEEVNTDAATEAEDGDPEALDAYQEAIGEGGPTGAEPVTDVDGREVSPEEMPANAVWPGQAGDAREQGAPAQEAKDEETDSE